MKKQKARPKEVYLNRVKCDCMAQKHDLINNCLNCGKVVCAQQGEGNCLYCGKLVTRPDGTFIDDSEQLFPSLSKEERVKVSVEQSKAIKHKNALVERDHSVNQKQNIFDEQVDYYDISENKWLDESDRQKAIDRILEKQQLNEEEEFKTRVVYDAVTGEFVRVAYEADEEGFKEEGKRFLQEREREEKMQKETLAKTRHNWDDRILRSDKLRDLCEDILSRPTQQVPQKVAQAKEKSSKFTSDIVIEEQS